MLETAKSFRMAIGPKLWSCICPNHFIQRLLPLDPSLVYRSMLNDDARRCYKQDHIINDQRAKKKKKKIATQNPIIITMGHGVVWCRRFWSWCDMSLRKRRRRFDRIRIKCNVVQPVVRVGLFTVNSRWELEVREVLLDFFDLVSRLISWLNQLIY